VRDRTRGRRQTSVLRKQEVVMNEYEATAARKDASVVGLGTMGVTLARLLLEAGYRVTVWNRTRSKADALVRAGAVLAPSAASAVAASRITVVCVYDYAAADEILRGKDLEGALSGRLLVQLTTGSAKEARTVERWAHGHGAEYLDGAIQAAPSQMGKPDTPLLLSGAEAAYRRAEPLLRILAGNVTYLGADAGAANAMDAATLSYVYGAMLGFVQGARISEAEGFRVDAYGDIVAGISPSFGEFFRHEGRVIQSGDFTVSESPLRISVEATARLEQLARESGINAAFPEFVAQVFRRAAEAGYADEEAAAIVKVLR
jgi:3-hydroxyisobutyrate dehydrogenase-like beta-hydroxyacid dehydrogenase